MKQEKLVIDGKEHLFNIYFEKRRDVSASLGKTAVHIRIPLDLPREEQFRHVLKMKQWAIQKLQEQAPQKKPEYKNYKDGETLQTRNKGYILRITPSPKTYSSVKLEQRTIILSVSNQITEIQQKKHISTLLSRVLATEHLPDIQRKVHELNQKHFNFTINKIRLKNQKTKWGSCSAGGNINLSTKLLFAPEDILEYVCIHELAHLKERNHSPNFWKLVEGAMPCYKEKKKWLRENEDKLHL